MSAAVNGNESPLLVPPLCDGRSEFSVVWLVGALLCSGSQRRIPFSAWSVGCLHRRQGESVPQVLVREDELFVELEQSLQRTRPGNGKFLETSAVGQEAVEPETHEDAGEDGAAEKPKEEADDDKRKGGLSEG